MALRFTIGWHFFNEGQKKLTEGFSSRGFLSQAKGPMAGMFHGTIPDYDGTLRFDTEQTLQDWALYKDRLNSHFSLNKQQIARTQEVYDRYEGLLLGLRPLPDKPPRPPRSETQNDYRDKYAEYQRELIWLEESTAPDNGVQEVEFQEAHILERQGKVSSLRAQLLAPLDQLWDEYEREMNNIPSNEQYSQAKFFRLPRPGEHAGDLRFVDWFIPRLHLVLGFLLMIGFLTRPSAIAAGLFLLSVILTQPYWVPGSISVQYQVVEFLAVLAVAAVGAGKWFGVDAFLAAAYRQWIAKKKGPSHEPNA